MIHSTRGVSLLELLVATVMITGIFMTAMTMIPKSMRSLVGFGKRSQALQLATSQLQVIRSLPYGRIVTTPPDLPAGSNYFNLKALATPGHCSCSNSNFNFTSMPSPSIDHPYNRVYTIGSSNYTLKACISLVQRVGNAWVAECAQNDNSNDGGFKSIRIQVSWENAVNPIEMETIVLR